MAQIELPPLEDVLNYKWDSKASIVGDWNEVWQQHPETAFVVRDVLGSLAEEVGERHEESQN